MEVDSSQADIMASQSQVTLSQDPSQVPPSQESTSHFRNSTKHVFDHIILFNWEKDLENPFKIYSVNDFQSKEIPQEWLLHQVRDSSRCRKLKPLPTLPGEILTLFAKVEKGCSRTRHKDVLEALNLEFNQYLREGQSISVAYPRMVQNNRYRVLARNSYDSLEQPLVSDVGILKILLFTSLFHTNSFSID